MTRYFFIASGNRYYGETKVYEYGTFVYLKDTELDQLYKCTLKYVHSISFSQLYHPDTYLKVDDINGSNHEGNYKSMSPPKFEPKAEYKSLLFSDKGEKESFLFQDSLKNYSSLFLNGYINTFKKDTED